MLYRPLVPIYRPSDLASEIAEEKAKLRDLLAQSEALLREPLPDTFLGRQRHHFIPLPFVEE